MMNHPFVVQRVNKKGQGEIHPALVLLSGLLMDRHSLPKDGIHISLFNCIVKRGKWKSPLPFSFPLSISTPQAGLEPAFYPSAKDRLIQLDDRGVLSFDNEANRFDNLSINACFVKGDVMFMKFLCNHLKKSACVWMIAVFIFCFADDGFCAEDKKIDKKTAVVGTNPGPQN